MWPCRMLEHMEDPDFNSPVPVPAPAPSTDSASSSESSSAAAHTGIYIIQLSWMTTTLLASLLFSPLPSTPFPFPFLWSHDLSFPFYSSPTLSSTVFTFPLSPFFFSISVCVPFLQPSFQIYLTLYSILQFNLCFANYCSDWSRR